MFFGDGIVATRIRRHLVSDPYSGEDTLGDWQHASLLAIGPCAFAPSSSTEGRDIGRDQISDYATLYAPLRSDFRALDRVAVGGSTWDVEGTPAEWRSPFSGREWGMVVSLRRVSG